MRILLSVVIAASLTACVTPPDQRPDWCSVECMREAKEARDLASRERMKDVSWGTASEKRRQESYEQRMALAKHQEEAARGEYLTPTGPKLSVYGPVGASAYSQVIDCKFDVSQSLIHDQEKRARFADMCYDLLPVDKRELFREKDRRKYEAVELPLILPIIVVKP